MIKAANLILIGYGALQGTLTLYVHSLFHRSRPLCLPGTLSESPHTFRGTKKARISSRFFQLYSNNYLLAPLAPLPTLSRMVES